MVLLMTECGRGTEIITEHGVMHKVHRDVPRSVLELVVGSGDTGMAQRVRESVQRSPEVLGIAGRRLRSCDSEGVSTEHDRVI
jgi:hypothetical protein